MSPQTTLDAESATRLFRAYVFKPAEGVFLFHPRAMERLVAEHLDAQGQDSAVPDLVYYLMPSPAFLRGLESENPEALIVIEGLSLPDQVILLPMPVEQRLDHAAFNRLLRDYWGRRFEAEVARAWQIARDDDQNDHRFGADALCELIGSPAFAEARDILTRDAIIPAGLDAALVCRAFVARVVRLRYFSPGARGFFFPAIYDWNTFDQWLTESGFDLPPPRPGSRLPRLLEQTRPDRRCDHPSQPPFLPGGLTYGYSDPDFDPMQTRVIRQEPLVTPERNSDADPANAPPEASTIIETRCLAALRQGLRQPRKNWRLHLHEMLLGVWAFLLYPLLWLPTRIRRRGSPPPPARGLRLDVALIRFRQAIRTASQAELIDHYAISIDQLARAQRRFDAMHEPCAATIAQITGILTQRRLGAEEALANLLAAKWKLGPESATELAALVERLGADCLDSRRARAARSLLRNLEQVLLESRTTYYHLRPLQWVFSLGRVRLRQILPVQAHLKALRELDVALNRLEQLGWSSPDVEHFGQPLQALSQRLTVQLEAALKPHLKDALQTSGFTAGSHRERVAVHKLLRELLDVIQRRRHLKFTDVRDIVARNSLRLPDLAPRELLTGDRLAHFDRRAARALPGVYQPGEIYIKGLQQISAPLFGTPMGRLLLRHLIVPGGLAFLGLKTIDVLIGLIIEVDPAFHLANLWLTGSCTLLINVIAYTRLGLLTARALLRGFWWSLRLILFDGVRRLLRWRPVTHFLETSLVRGLDRNLLRPFLIGALLILPLLGLLSFIEGALVKPDLSLLAFALALGALVRNTAAGRRLLDDSVSATGRFLRRLNQTLVIGFVQELMGFFKEVNRRFQQGLHRIEELLSHRLGESGLELALKSMLAPLWRILETISQFYVTVLVEPQVNPIKHFPLVTIAHKLMLPFFPLITSLMITLLDPFLPRWIAYPFITITILLLPGLAGFLVWELKENWKLYAANHPASVEPAIVGSHGETMRGMLRRGFHSGTLPKAFDRLRRVLGQQIRDGAQHPSRLREVQRHLAEIERTICVFCDRELTYALHQRSKDPVCALSRVETRRPRLATNSFELTLDLYTPAAVNPGPIEIRLCICLMEPDDLHLRIRIAGPRDNLHASCWELVREDIELFGRRAGATQILFN